MKILLMAIYTQGMNRMLDEVGISSIASYLRQFKYDVMIIGTNDDKVNYKQILDYGPDIIGVNIYSTSKQSVYDIVKKLKIKLPDTTICAGGYVPTFNAEEVLRESEEIDICVRGEGEITFKEVVERMEEGRELDGVRGITYRKLDRIITNPDRPKIKNLDELPFPARDMLKDNKMYMAGLSTSRGCTSKCSFCAAPFFWKNWRGKDVIISVDEIENIISTCNINVFHFLDGSFHDPDLNNNRVKSLAEEIVKRGLKICYIAGFRTDFHIKASPDLMKVLKESGLCIAFIGVESNSEKDLKLYNKRASLEDNMKAIELFRNHEIYVEIGFINFNPYSSFTSLRENIDFLEVSNHASNIFHFTTKAFIYDGTSLGDKIRNDKLIVDFKNGVAKYTFIDDRIEMLCNYLNDESSSVLNYDHIRRLSFYTSNYNEYISVLKRQSLLQENIQAIDYLKEYEEFMFDKMRYLSKEHAKWFRLLVELAEYGWQVEKADKIVSDILLVDSMVSLTECIEKKIRLLHKNLFKTGLEYTGPDFS